MIPQVTDYIADHVILQLALWSLIPIVVGAMLRRPLPFLSAALRLVGHLGLLVALMLAGARLLDFR